MEEPKILYNEKKLALITLILLNILVSGQNKQPAISKVGVVQIVQVEPTPLFPKPQKGEALKQLVRLYLDNSGMEVDAVAKGHARYTETRNSGVK